MQQKSYAGIKILMFCMLNFLATKTNCQSSIVIKYDWTRLNYKPVNSFSIHSWQTPIDLRMVTNDSFALVYIDNSSFNIEDIRKHANGKLINNASFFDFTTGERFYEVSLSTDDKYLLKDSLFTWNWQFPAGEKMILNKLCHPALSVNKNNDSILIWYTKELDFQNGPIWYDSIPGIILEVFDQKLNAHIKAFKIRKKDITIRYPQEGTKISISQWRTINKTIYSRRKD